MHSHAKTRIIVLVLVLGLIPNTTFGQVIPKREPDNCEMISSKLDFVGAKLNSNGTDFIIIIGSFPTSMRSKSADALLADSLRYLVKFHGVSDKRVAFGSRRASGGREGELQFFVKGELVSVINVAQGSRICSGIGETLSKRVP